MRRIHALAVILTAVSLIPGGAHVAELFNKLGLGREEYFLVQQIYQGWALFGIAIIAAFAANLALTFLLWRRREPFSLPAIACLCIAASLAVFFVWVYPTNLATSKRSATMRRRGIPNPACAPVLKLRCGTGAKG
jgi:hypothetical protein